MVGSSHSHASLVSPTADDAEQSDDGSTISDGDDDGVESSCEYELIGVTVHTGTADGGHYYSFIRDRLNKNELGQDLWLVALSVNI